ncbi:hypothetical protein QF017_001061 [Pseudomonas laurylsulfatiphila]
MLDQVSTGRPSAAEMAPSFNHTKQSLPMSQMSFSDFEYAGKRKQARRKRFLAEMEQVVSWSRLVALIEPHYPKAGGSRNQTKCAASFPMDKTLGLALSD